MAAGKVKSLLEQEGRDDLALRISVQPGGCSGLRYQLFFDERTLDGDVVTDFDGVAVVVDRMSVPYLNGAMIDFVDIDREAGLHDRQPQRHRLLRLRRLASTEAHDYDESPLPIVPRGLARTVVAGSVQVQVERVRQPLGRLGDPDLPLGTSRGKSSKWMLGAGSTTFSGGALEARLRR